MRIFSKSMAVGGAALLAMAMVDVKDAAACGCFVPPDPSVPIVQAGERIVFAMEGGEVVAHIQIQYAGNDGEFGWLLPLPAVPTLELGTDELFTSITNQTQPKYKLRRVYEGNCSFDPARFGGFGNQSASPTAGGSREATDGDSSSPLVIQDSVGPYDYAVLKADDKADMLKWLNDNRYFVPAGTDESVGPYIRQGAFFLALRLRSGNAKGDLQPVVLKYKSDLPMIPIILTAVAANPNMGVQVWMLGSGRAIPRNYYHTVINDSLLDWNNGSQNYNDVIIKAVGEAPGKHSFVTEYAGKSDVMKKVLNAEGRFGLESELAASPNEIGFVQYLQQHQFAFTGQLTSILARYIPIPDALKAQGIQAQQFYQNLTYYLGSYRQQRPQDFIGYSTNFQPAMMASEIFERVVQPTLKAGALFDSYPYLTRLYTTISPEDMNKDPVFSYNKGLKDHPNEHEGTLTYHCGLFGDRNQATTPATLRTAHGWVLSYPYGVGSGPALKPLPGSLRTEILREEGLPEITADNSTVISNGLGNSGGCGYVIGGRAQRAGGVMGLLLVGALLLLRRRRAA